MDADEKAENLERQAEEAEALSAIYGEDFSSGADGVWTVRVRVRDDDDEPSFAADGTPMPETLTVRVAPLETYPSRAPPLVELAPAAALPFDRYDRAMDAVDETHEENQGEVMVFAYVERLRAMCDEWRAEDGANEEAGVADVDAEDADADADADANADVWDPEALEAELAASAADRIASPSASAPETTEALEDELDARIVHGAPRTVKKSTFQAHVCGGLTDASQVDAVMSALRRDGKVARATHNIMAYRVGPLPGTEDVWAQDHDEDGENAAGKGLLHLLQVTRAANVCVVVSRWYGGVHLGPDRFKVINNVARDLLEACGEIERKGDGKGARR